MNHKLILVRLDPDQVAKAKAANGPRKRITHALLCGPYGQIFGTEKHCRKYFNAWQEVFPTLFDEGVEPDEHDIADYNSTFNLVLILLEHVEGRQASTHSGSDYTG